MIYKIVYDADYNMALEVGDVVYDENEVSIKVLSIIKIDSYRGKTVIHVLGANMDNLI